MGTRTGTKIAVVMGARPGLGRWRWLLAALLLLGLAVGVPSARDAGAAPGRRAVPTELVVVPRALASATAVAQDLPARYGDLQTLAVGLSGRVLLLRVPAGREDEYRQRLAADPAVAAVSRNYEVSTQDGPLTPDDQSFSDPAFQAQYGKQWGLTAIRAPEAWGMGVRGSGVTVAVIDTGADYGHPDLAAALLPGCSFLSFPATCGPTAAGDDNGHGTHVAGLIAATTNNGLGVAGVAWEASILPLKALDSGGNGSWFAITDAIGYAANQPGVRVINLSLGSDPGFPPEQSEIAPLQGAIDNARAKGIAVVVASGNSGVNLDTTPIYPASLPGVIAVTAVDENGVKPAWANYGSPIAVAAPGAAVLSTLCAYSFASQSCTHAYGKKSGTSMASPHVAALAALLFARTPGLTPEGVASAIKMTATDLGAPGPDTTFGSGRIDLAAAFTPPPVTLSVTASGPGQVGASPSAATLPLGAVATLTATPERGAIFAGWTVDGAARGWASPFALTMDRAHTVTARFVPRPAFADLTIDPTGEAIVQLAARGIARGYGDGTYGALDPIVRAQIAGLLVRAMGWEGERYANTFTDRGPVDDALWAAIGTLVHYGVAKGYGDGTYGPTDPLLHIQAISAVSRAMVARGLWTQAVADDPAIYPNVPFSSGHRLDLVTFVRNAGPVANRPTAGGAAWADWDGPASRGWFALVLWQALDATLGK